MGSSKPDSAVSGHRVVPDTRPRMVKADLRKADGDGWKGQIARAIAETQSRSGLSLKEFAAHLERDERQVSRWLAGAERPQIDRIFAVPAFRALFLIALAEMAGVGVELETTIRLRRIA